MNNYKSKNNLSNSDIIKASEIGQYQFCSISWKLQKNGYLPDSPLLNKGKEIHISQGKNIDKINVLLRKYKISKILGYFLLVIAIIIIFYEVIF